MAAVKTVKSELRDARAKRPDEFLDRVFWTGYGRPHVGFKIFLGQNDRVRLQYKYIEHYRNVINTVREHGQAYYPLNYEDVNDELMFTGVLTFIGAGGDIRDDEMEFRKEQVKQNTSNILQRFSNPDLVERFLAERNLQHRKYEGGTSHAPMHAENPVR
jgi:hypothetical protein